MHKFLLQHQKMLIFSIGCVLIPCMLASTLLWMGFSERNFSGLLAESTFFPWIHIGSLLMLAWLCMMLWIIARDSRDKKQIIIQLLILSILISSALFIRWDFDNSLLQSIHIFLSYAAFVYMNLMFYRYCSSYVNERNIYLCIAATAFLISLGAGEVLGVSEVLYGAGCSVLLTLIVLKN
jgi:ABC-type Na+ efflux pump permease subunit